MSRGAPAPHVGRRGPVARHGFLHCLRGEHGAVFVWSMYLAFGPDGYIRYGLEDPLLALASRTVSMNEQLHNPPWANEWIVDQAKRHRIDAALVLTPLGTRPSATGNRFIEIALERAGIPGVAGLRRHGGCAELGCGRDAPQSLAHFWSHLVRRTQHWVISVAAVILAMMAIQMSSLGFSPLLPAIRKELGGLVFPDGTVHRNVRDHRDFYQPARGHSGGPLRGEANAADADSP